MVRYGTSPFFRFLNNENGKSHSATRDFQS